MTIYRDGVAEPRPDPAVIAVLRSHEWDALGCRCLCGWSQRGVGIQGRRMARLNHPEHVAAQLAKLR